MTALLQARRAYDHRLRDQVRQNGALAQLRELKIPRSTVASYGNRGPRPVVTQELFGQDRQLALDRIEKLTRRRECASGRLPWSVPTSRWPPDTMDSVAEGPILWF
jgi:hypothetical protein